MSDPAGIVAEAGLCLGTESLEGQTVLVTAGGTAEAIDAVRRITNRSSGKMGFAIAEQAARRGARVRLVAGVTHLPTPAGVERIDVESAHEMREAVLDELEASTIVIKAAAVADFTPENVESQKIKKEGLGDQSAFMLRLVKTPDILREVCDRKENRIVVGFAAESHDVLEEARRKIRRKGCDLLVANDISRTDAGFDVDTNAVLLVTPDGEVEETALLSKREIASQVLDRVEKILQERLG